MVNPIRPPLEDYDKHWGFASFRGKIVLDIGADWGTTAQYFLQHGAKKVVAVEGNEEYVSELFRNYDDNPNVLCIEMMVKTPKQFEDLISTYEPDIVKGDIEGDEHHLLGVPVEILSSIREWLIEVHCRDQLEKKLFDLFLSLGYKVEFRYEVHSVKVLWARKNLPRRLKQ